MRNQAPFIEQRDDRFVLHRLINRIFVDQPPERIEGVLVLLQKRRAGEAEIAGVRQDTPHLQGELAVTAIAACLAAVAFIDENEDVGAIILEVIRLDGGIELVDDCRNQWCAVPDQLDQVRPRSCTHRFKVAGPKGALDLFVQVIAIRNNQDARVLHVLVESKRAPKHHHRQALP